MTRHQPLPLLVLFLALSILLTTSCKDEAGKGPPASSTLPATPAATATPSDPAQDCFPAPVELGDPGPMRRDDVPGAAVFVTDAVTAEDEQRVLDGLSAAQAYFEREFGPVRSFVCVEVRANDLRSGSAVTVENRIIVFTQPGGWTRAYPWLLSRAIAHEYAHVWAAEVARGFAPATSGAFGPGWLVEGAADFLSMQIVLGANLAPADEAQAFSNTLLSLSRANLDDLEALPLPNPEDYALAELAVEQLLSSRPLSALSDYYRLLGQDTSWPLAFSRAFGISPSQFYEQFAARR